MQVICKSGITGWQDKLQKVYKNFKEFEERSVFYGLATKLGYKSAKAAWKANPTVQGSVLPSDYRKIKK